MIVDTLAIVAVLGTAPDAERYRSALRAADIVQLSALTCYECRVVLGIKFDHRMVEQFELLLEALDARVVPFDADRALLAHAAYRQFGRGSGHPARLNLADCAAYVLAIEMGEPLLFKGEDFSRTDVTSALA